MMVPAPQPFVIPETMPGLDLGPALGPLMALATASVLLGLLVLIVGVVTDRRYAAPLVHLRGRRDADLRAGVRPAA